MSPKEHLLFVPSKTSPFSPFPKREEDFIKVQEPKYTDLTTLESSTVRAFYSTKRLGSRGHVKTLSNRSLSGLHQKEHSRHRWSNSHMIFLARFARAIPFVGFTSSNEDKPVNLRGLRDLHSLPLLLSKKKAGTKGEAQKSLNSTFCVYYVLSSACAEDCCSSPPKSVLIIYQAQWSPKPFSGVEYGLGIKIQLWCIPGEGGLLLLAG